LDFILCRFIGTIQRLSTSHESTYRLIMRADLVCSSCPSSRCV